MNLIGTECVLQYVLSVFRSLNSAIAKELEQKFIRRMMERRNSQLIHLILFLRDPSFWDKEKDVFGIRIYKHQIKKIATKLVKRLFPADISALNPSVDLPYDMDDDVDLFEGSPPRELSQVEKLEVKLLHIL